MLNLFLSLNILTVNMQELLIYPHSFIKLYINFKSESELLFTSNLEIPSEIRNEITITIKGKIIVVL